MLYTRRKCSEAWITLDYGLERFRHTEGTLKEKPRVLVPEYTTDRGKQRRSRLVARWISGILRLVHEIFPEQSKIFDSIHVSFEISLILSLMINVPIAVLLLLLPLRK